VGTVLNNTATVYSNVTDPNGVDNTSTAATTVTAAQADLAITKTAAAMVSAGSNLTYSITVTNRGPSPATSVSLIDTLPPRTSFVSLVAPAGWVTSTPVIGGTGSVIATNSSLASGASASFALVVNVAGATVDGRVFANTATVSAASTDADTGNNASTVTTTVGTVGPPAPIPALSKWAMPLLGMLLAAIGVLALMRRGG